MSTHRSEYARFVIPAKAVEKLMAADARANAIIDFPAAEVYVAQKQDGSVITYIYGPNEHIED